jgi:hypothetical protein
MRCRLMTRDVIETDVELLYRYRYRRFHVSHVFACLTWPISRPIAASNTAYTAWGPPHIEEARQAVQQSKPDMANRQQSGLDMDDSAGSVYEDENGMPFVYM